MDRNKKIDKELALDQLMQRASASIVKSLDATVDVKQRLHDLLREAGVDPALVQERSRR
ncbi:hypothetical protein ACFQS1_38280 [Paractinoplanes rhizophilus]|uniref:Uncharacterized protein n=1 Tax=Paractinoplanes rhizophilus TaxID=1416877 RepID=A0ABW2I4S6_9ACTN